MLKIEKFQRRGYNITLQLDNANKDTLNRVTDIQELHEQQSSEESTEEENSVEDDALVLTHGPLLPRNRNIINVHAFVHTVLDKMKAYNTLTMYDSQTFIYDIPVFTLLADDERTPDKWFTIHHEGISLEEFYKTHLIFLAEYSGAKHLKSFAIITDRMREITFDTSDKQAFEGNVTMLVNAIVRTAHQLDDAYSLSKPSVKLPKHKVIDVLNQYAFSSTQFVKLSDEHKCLETIELSVIFSTDFTNATHNTMQTPSLKSQINYLKHLNTKSVLYLGKIDDITYIVALPNEFDTSDYHSYLTYILNQIDVYSKGGPQ